jgi:2-polyprenyl-3-methyl-5-hydroxy-6-metoxy-1,4-benzoquinol methylase
LKIKYKNFFEVVKKDLEKYNYSKNYKSIIQGHEEKLGILNTDYESWIKKLINFFKTNFFIDFEKSKKIKILDFGSGTGELVIQMNFAGAHAKGVELHKKHLKFSSLDYIF